MRTKKALLNSATALLLELVTVVCGFILPGLILSAFGSKYNGITSSISQFLGYIALLKSGIGGVTRASLYKPLQENDVDGVSAIVMATEKFMRQIALIFSGFLVVFAALYPFFKSKEFPWLFSFTLVLILGIGTFSQYYFGITYQMLLQADQRQYISSAVQIVTTIVNTIVAAILIKAGGSIHVVKLGSAIVFALNPIVINIYVRKKYKINRKIAPNTSAIAQRWDSFAHQIANFVHGNTDVAILTIFSAFTYSDISVYSVYAMVVSGVRKLVNTLASGMEAAFGNMIAKKEDKLLLKNMELLEFVILYVGGFCFACAIVLIVPFVLVYTSKVHDADYNRPLFGTLLCVAELLWCVRIPYQSVVLAGGKFKETRNGAIAEPIINIVISVILVFKLGLVGVAIGTLIAMAFRTVQYAVYMSKHIVPRSLWVFVRKISIAAICITLSCLAANYVKRECGNYFDWMILACMRAGIIFVIHMIFIMIFERKNFVLFWKKLGGIFKRKAKKKAKEEAKEEATEERKETENDTEGKDQSGQ